MWCAIVIWGLLLCSADDETAALAQANSTPLNNSAYDSVVDADFPKTTNPSPDTSTRGFILFRIFQWRSKTRENKVRGIRKREMKERTASLALKMNEKLEEARQMLLDRMATVSFNLINHEHDASINGNSTFFQLDGDPDDVTPQSDLSRPNRSIYVVTTAGELLLLLLTLLPVLLLLLLLLLTLLPLSTLTVWMYHINTALPWRTGTAVNPLLRAAYLSRRLRSINSQNSTSRALLAEVAMHSNETIYNETLPTSSTKQYVTLVIPWLELEEDRLELYGPNKSFATCNEQEAYIRDWLRHDANMPEEADQISGLRILFYPARYHSGLKSIFAMGDICAVLRNQTTHEDLSDAVCILEEPEHLNWYRAPGEGWTKVFNFVVGIVHTNYIELHPPNFMASGQLLLYK
jgi:hypothetical protein